MFIQPYLYFNGSCREALEFYTEVFETEEPEIMTFGDVPFDPDNTVSGEMRHYVMHAKINIKGTELLLSDVFAGATFVAGNNVHLTIISEDMEEIKTLFGRLKEGGSVDMELQETFFSKCYGSLKDKFGIPWQLGYHEKNRLQNPDALLK